MQYVSVCNVFVKEGAGGGLLYALIHATRELVKFEDGLKTTIWFVYV